jgi:hypothetical protein
MIASLLRLASIACSLILVVSFVLFATDQARSGEKQQVAKLAGGGTAGDSSSDARNNINQANPSAATERLREKRHGSVREAIDDANDVLVSPFTGIVSDSSSIWVQRAVPGLIALLVFGLALRFLASFVSTGRWR